MIGVQGFGVYFWNGGELKFCAFFVDKEDAQRFANIKLQFETRAVDVSGEVFPMKIYTQIPLPNPTSNLVPDARKSEYAIWQQALETCAMQIDRTAADNPDEFAQHISA